jgi:nitrate reductase (cytochrome)
MKLDRRRFILSTAAGSAVATATALFPGIVFADWPKITSNSGVVSWQKAPCRFCGTGCGVLVGTRGEGGGGQGRSQLQRQQGFLLHEGLPLGPGPVRRRPPDPAKIRKNGEMVEVPIAEALDLVAAKLKETRPGMARIRWPSTAAASGPSPMAMSPPSSSKAASAPITSRPTPGCACRARSPAS